MNYSELKQKSVINVSDGKDLGKVTDIAFTFPEGCVTALIVGEKKFFSSGERYEIDFCCVKKIGDDAVLVDLKKEKEAAEEE